MIADLEVQARAMLADEYERAEQTGYAQVLREPTYLTADLQIQLAALATSLDRVRVLEEALEPFALHIKDGVPDDRLISFVAWTAGQHRAARQALSQGGD